MQGAVGDTVVIHSRRVDQAERTGTISEVRGADGPYLVRFQDGSEILIFPGSDCVISPAGSER